jgi:hypothetical protein
MGKQTVSKGLYLLFSAVLIAILAIGIAPAPRAGAQEMTSTSDLIVSVVSAPKHVRDCEVFEVTFAVTNLGPDPVSALDIHIGVPDAFAQMDVPEAPDSLAVGETATFTVVIQVTSFFKGNDRKAWALARVFPSPDFRVDPNLENNRTEASIRIIGPDKSCF